jgi:hypothetical protein
MAIQLMRLYIGATELLAGLHDGTIATAPQFQLPKTREWTAAMT